MALQAGGLVARTRAFSQMELQPTPFRRDILLACEKYWTFLPEWTGVQLSFLLNLVVELYGVAHGAVYIVTPAALVPDRAGARRHFTRCTRCTR